MDIRTHGIVNVIERLLAEPWPPSVEIGREVPEAKPEDDCVVSRTSHFGILLAYKICRNVIAGILAISLHDLARFFIFVMINTACIIIYNFIHSRRWTVFRIPLGIIFITVPFDPLQPRKRDQQINKEKNPLECYDVSRVGCRLYGV